MNTILGVLLLLGVGLHKTQGCGSKSIECLNSTSYQYCFDVGGSIIYVEGIQTCGVGTICDENEGLYACIDDTSSTTTTESTTTSTTTTESTTTSTDTTPTIMCTVVTSTTPISTTTTTERTTTTTDSTTTTTESATPASTTDSGTSTTSTIQSVTAPETCTSTGVYEAENCYQYYECVFVMWWYELVLQTCDSGQSFNVTAAACTDDSTCISS